MKTGCPDCDYVQAKTGDKTRLCFRHERSYEQWCERVARRRGRLVAETQRKIELGTKNA